MLCGTCQSELPVGALFCGECGSSVSAVQPQPTPVSATPTSTAPAPDSAVTSGSPSPADSVGSPQEDFAKSDEGDDALTNIVPQLSPNEFGELFIAEDKPASPPRVFATNVELDTVASFTVTLATGESVEMTRNALVGRMPQSQPGEVYEHLIVVTDPGRSVSKTHLEIGIDNGSAWILDRQSGNGSIIREPGVVPRRAQPGTQYPVVRGTRIDMGDQHLTID